jgi:hypothetical protein
MKGCKLQSYSNGKAFWRDRFIVGFATLCVTVVSYGAPASDNRPPINWPLGRSGRDRVLLDVPIGFASRDRAANAMNSAVYGPGGPPNINDQIHEDLLLTALWPELVPDNGANHGEFNLPGGGRIMMALIHSAAIEDYEHRHYNALQADYDIAIESSTKRLCVGVMAQSRCYKRETADAKPSQFGLQRLGVDFSKYPDFPEQDRSGLPERDIYYLRGPGGDLETVILCMAEESKTVDDGPQYRMVGQCEHKFVFKPLNAFVSIHYRRVYLQDWQAIQTEWEKLLQSFIVEPSAAGGNAAK